jgi:hypothetical protein
VPAPGVNRPLADRTGGGKRPVLRYGLVRWFLRRRLIDAAADLPVIDIRSL